MLLVATTVSGQKILNGDLNHDGKIDIADVTAIVDVAIGRSQAEEFIIAAPLDIAPHEYVDLELPSGTLWATCNVGATNPEDYGDYFAWGETEGFYSGKMDFSWSTYKYYKINGNVEGLTKYCTDSRYGYEGFTDSLTVLAFTDDAATANWGWEWRTPTFEQIEELFNYVYTHYEITTMNGVPGLKIISYMNEESIFLPAPGFYDYMNIFFGNQIGTYWSRTCENGSQKFAHTLYFDSYEFEPYELLTRTCSRYEAHSVRPVRNK